MEEIGYAALIRLDTFMDVLQQCGTITEEAVAHALGVMARAQPAVDLTAPQFPVFGPQSEQADPIPTSWDVGTFVSGMNVMVRAQRITCVFRCGS